MTFKLTIQDRPVRGIEVMNTPLAILGILFAFSMSAQLASSQDPDPRSVASTEPEAGDTNGQNGSETPAAQNPDSLPTLPTPGQSPTGDGPVTQEEIDPILDTYVAPGTIARQAFAPPPNAKSISKNHLWIDSKRKRVILDGYVAMNDGPLEMFACPEGTKEHESIIGTLPGSKEVHAALLAVGAKHGTPVEFLPRFVPATGQRIRIWVCYRDKEGKFQAVDGRRWVKQARTGKQMEPDWVFSGSGFWKDPATGQEYYRADSGDMICVSNFNSAMMDIPVASSADANDLLFLPFTSRIPPQGTPLRLVLVPIPLYTDKPADAAQGDTPSTDTKTPPSKSILPARPKSKSTTKPAGNTSTETKVEARN
jgi:hypothetical protein